MSLSTPSSLENSSNQEIRLQLLPTNISRAPKTSALLSFFFLFFPSSLFPPFLPPSFLSEIITIFIIWSFAYLGLHPQHMEVPRLGAELELKLLAYTTATAMPDP